MSKVYDSLLQEMQERLNRVRSPSTQVIRLQENQAIALSEELDQFQKNVGDQIARFKNAISEGEAVVNNDIRNTAETIQKRQDDIAALKEQVRAGEERLRQQQADAKQLQEQLSSKIQDLENDWTNQQQALHAQERDIAKLKEHNDGQFHEIRELRYALEESRLEVTGHMKQIDALTVTFTTRTSELERELFETERIVAEKESDIQLATEKLTAGAREFKEGSRKKENLLKAREAEITRLRGQLQLLTRGVSEMSSFFTQVGAFGDSDSRSLLEAIAEENQEELIPDCSEPVTQTISATPSLTEEAMPAQFCHDLAAELTDAVGPIAAVILRDQLKALGASVEALPKGRVTELLDLLADEILEPSAKAQFRARFSHYNPRVKEETAVPQ